MVKALYIAENEEPCLIQTDTDLKTLQRLVGGNIEAFSVLCGDEPLLWINEEGLFNNLPNRAVYATKEMEEQGYLSQIDGSVVGEGDLYSILHGPILAISYDRDPETGDDVARDITSEEIVKLFNGLGDLGSGMAEAFLLRMKIS